MRTDGVFTVRESRIVVKPGEPFQLDQFGDNHRDSPACAVEKWREFLERVGRLSNPYLLGMGDADIYLIGENHARGCFRAGERLRVMNGNTGRIMRSRHPWPGRTGSFLKGCVDGEASYVVNGGMPPASLGWIEFEIVVNRDHSGGHDRRTVEITARR